VRLGKSRRGSGTINGWSPIRTSFFLQRYMAHVDAHYGKHFRTFVQLKSGIETFRYGGPRPIDEKRLDFNAGFLDVCVGAERDWIAFRVGRQELNYGSGRLVAVREGPNVRQSFDGFKIMSQVGLWRIDGSPCIRISITLDSLTIIPTTKPPFGGYTARALSAAAFRWDLY
jgi:hypothetical protein